MFCVKLVGLRNDLFKLATGISPFKCFKFDFVKYALFS